MKMIEEVPNDIKSLVESLNDIADEQNPNNQTFADIKTAADILTIFIGIPFGRINAIGNAERDGRCMTPPCKVGDTVYTITSGEVVKEKIVGIQLLGEDHMLFYFDHMKLRSCILQSFGETVFLTRPEAEAALKGESHD